MSTVPTTTGFQWAHQTGSKKMASHAYPIGCVPNAMPVCGNGCIWRCTTFSDTVKKRKNRLTRCRNCQRIVAEAKA